jgi:hypothetical protein
MKKLDMFFVTIIVILTIYIIINNINKKDIVYVFIIGILVIYLLCKNNNSNEGFTTNPKSLSDIDAIKNLAAVAKDLQTVNGITIPGNITLGGATIQKAGEGGAGRLHITGGELLYLLNKNGVIIGKEWGGNGYLQVQGKTDMNDINAAGKLTVGGPDSTYATVNIRNSDGRYTHIGVTGQPDRKFQNGSLFRGNVHMDNDLNIDGNQRIEGNISMGGNSTFSVDAPGVVGGRFNIDKDGNVRIKGNFSSGSSTFVQTKEYKHNWVSTNITMYPGLYLISIYSKDNGDEWYLYGIYHKTERGLRRFTNNGSIMSYNNMDVATKPFNDNILHMIIPGGDNPTGNNTFTYNINVLKLG